MWKEFLKIYRWGSIATVARSNDLDLEEGQREVLNSREIKRVRVGSGDDLDNIISVGVENHPCWEQ